MNRLTLLLVPVIFVAGCDDAEPLRVHLVGDRATKSCVHVVNHYCADNQGEIDINEGLPWFVKVYGDQDPSRICGTQERTSVMDYLRFELSVFAPSTEATEIDWGCRPHETLGLEAPQLILSTERPGTRDITVRQAVPNTGAGFEMKGCTLTPEGGCSENKDFCLGASCRFAVDNETTHTVSFKTGLSDECFWTCQGVNVDQASSSCSLELPAGPTAVICSVSTSRDQNPTKAQLDIGPLWPVLVLSPETDCTSPICDIVTAFPQTIRIYHPDLAANERLIWTGADCRNPSRDSATVILDQPGAYTCVPRVVANPLVDVTIDLVRRDNSDSGPGAVGTVDAIGTEMRCIEDICTATAEDQDTLQLTARPNEGYTFVGWGGDCQGTSPEITQMIEGPLNCEAVFERDVTCNETPDPSFVLEDNRGNLVPQDGDVYLIEYGRYVLDASDGLEEFTGSLSWTITEDNGTVTNGTGRQFEFDVSRFGFTGPGADIELTLEGCQGPPKVATGRMRLQ